MVVRVRVAGFQLGFPLLWLLLALLGAVLFTGLGRWQWHRAGEKRAIAAEFAGAATASEPLGRRSPRDLARYARIALVGHFDADHQFLLDNMNHGSQAGYQVLTPFVLEDGRWWLVNRGWTPLVDGGRTRLPDLTLLTPASGTLQVHGRIDELPAAGLASGRAAPTLMGSWPRLTTFPTTADLAAALGHSLEPRQLLLDADQPHGFIRDWQPASASFGPERHIAYAVQWWSLAVLSIGLYLVMNLRRVS
jgi:surfeit locus 1 family protein